MGLDRDRGLGLSSPERCQDWASPRAWKPGVSEAGQESLDQPSWNFFSIPWKNHSIRGPLKAAGFLLPKGHQWWASDYLARGGAGPWPPHTFLVQQQDPLPVQHSCVWAAGSLPTGTPKPLGCFHPRPYGQRNTDARHYPSPGHRDHSRQDNNGRAWGFWPFC